MKFKKEVVLKRAFLGWHKLMSKMGFQVLHRHFYSCVPDLNELARTKELWAKKSEMPGVDADLDRQVESLKEICLPFQKEYAGNAVYLEALRQGSGHGYGYIEAQALHGFLRHLKPRRIVEVGSGVSTRCALAALKLNASEGSPGRITCVEPYPYPWLKSSTEVELVEKQVQETPLELFTSLSDGDLLFIDSSHTVKPGSDVNFEILEILPRLQSGVRVHFHDIYLPFDYQRQLLKTFYFWTENTLLRAFLTDNSRAKIIFALSMLHYDRPDQLRQVFPEYQRQAGEDGLTPSHVKPFEDAPGHFPSSLYLQIGEQC